MTAQMNKGDRVRARWLDVQCEDPVALAGMQLKFQATEKAVEGEVTHIRTNDPVGLSDCRVWIQPDEGPEIHVPLRAIEGVIS